MTKKEERLEDKNPRWLVKFLEDYDDLPDELVRRSIGAIIDSGDLGRIAAVCHKIDLRDVTIEASLTLQVLLKLLEAIEKNQSYALKTDILMKYFASYPKSVQERVIGVFLSLNPSATSLLALLNTLKRRRGFREIRTQVFKQLVLGIKDEKLRMVLKVVARTDCPRDVRKIGIERIIASENPYFLYGLLRKFKFSKEERISFIKKILSKKEPGAAYLVIRDFPNLSPDLRSMALSRCHSTKIENITPLALNVIKEVLGQEWIIYSEDIKTKAKAITDYLGLRAREWNYDRDFRRMNDIIPEFIDEEWVVIDIENKTIDDQEVIIRALLTINRVRPSRAEKVFLWRDPSNLQERGAYLANPESQTIEEEMRHGFGIEDGKNFPGFLVEK
jgi:hypothetical protein